VEVNVALGRLAEARRAADELLALLARGITTFGALQLALAADDLGLRAGLGTVFERLPDRPWVQAARAANEGDFLRAADIAAESAWRVEEADLRLRAAETLVRAGRRAEADVQLQQALAFFRSVGATRFIRQGEALLAATA